MSQIYTWVRRGVGYEVSSIGDKRFSAFSAVLPDGRSIEQHYQCDVKGYDIGGTNWKLGKGKPPLIKSISGDQLYRDYLSLWWKWSTTHTVLMLELMKHANEHNHTLKDSFATTEINQARALADILTQVAKHNSISNW